MATTITGSTSSQYWTFKIVVTENSTNVSSNTSSVTVEAFLGRTGSASYLTNGKVTTTISMTGCSNQSISGTYTTGTIAAGGWYSLGSTTFSSVPHNSDGTKTVTVGASFTNNYSPSSGSASGNVGLTTIPRATSCPNLSGNIESSYNLSISPASSSFSHSLKIVFGSLTNWLQSNGTLGSSEYKFTNTTPVITIPSTYYAQFSGTYGTGTMTLYTYSGSTQIGSKTATITASCNSSLCTPTISGTAVVSDSLSTGLTGNTKNVIRYVSSVVITPTIKASATNDTSATVSSKAINGTTFTGSTYTVTKATSTSFTLKVVNSRGYSKEVTVSTGGSLIGYVPLTFSGDVYRPEPTTGAISIKYSGNYYNGSFGSKSNSLTITWKWKLKSASDYTTGGTLTSHTYSGTTYSSNAVSLGTSYTYTNQYMFQVTYSDAISSTTQTFSVTQGIPVFWWSSDRFVTQKQLLAQSNIIGPTIRSKLETLNGRITNANIAHTYDNDRAHMQLLQATSSMTSNKPAADGYIMHFSWDTSGLYNAQMAIPNNTGNYPVQFRGCNNGTWGSWEYMYRGKSLYDNSSGSSGTITLSESAANFSMIEIFARNNDGFYGSGKYYTSYSKISLGIATIDNSSPYNMVLKYKSMTINGTSLTNNFGGEVSIYGTTLNGHTNSNNIYIVKVIGYR